MSQFPRIPDAFQAARLPTQASPLTFPAIGAASAGIASTFQPQPPPIQSIQAQATNTDHFEALRKEREQMVDAKIMQTRATTPKSALEMRAVQRLSIKELNTIDFDAIKKRLGQSRFDDRPPLVKLIDLIDLPRNALFNIIAPATRDAQRARGETGAFGLPRIFTSDVLRELGVENRVVRAVVGFVGDVALDPLTYVGGAGIGIKVSAKTAGSGRIALQISKRSSKKLFRGIKAAADAGTTSAIRDETVRNLISTQVSDQVLQRATRRFGSDQVAGSVTRRITGDLKRSAAQKIFRTAKVADGGAIANRFFQVAEEAGSKAAQEIDAVRTFVLDGERSAIGLKIGKGGTQVLHVPFTSLNVQVPAFTAAGKTSIVAKDIGRLSAFNPRAAAATKSILQRGERLLDALQEEHAVTNAERSRFKRDKSVVAAVSEAETTGDLSKINAIIPTLPLDEQANAVLTGSGFVRGLQEASRIARQTVRDDRLDNIVQLAKSIQQDANIVSPAVDTQNALYLAKVRDIALNVQDRAEILKRGIGSTVNEGDLVSRLENANRIIENVPTETKTTDTLFGKFTETTAASSELQIAEAESDAIISDIHNAIGSAQRLADSTSSSLLTFLTDGEKDILEVVKATLGTNDDTIGASLLTPVIDAARHIFGEESVPAEWLRRIDRSKRQVFGNKSGEISASRRFAERGQSQVAARAYSQATGRIKRILTGVAEKHDLEPAQADELFHTLTAVLYSKREGASANFYKMPWVEGVGPVTVEEAIKLREGGHVVNNFAVELERSRRTGVLSNPGVRADLDAIAEELGVNVLDDLKVHAQEAGILGMSIEGYVNNILTKEGRDLVKTRRAAIVKSGREAKDAGDLLDATTARERFQHHRTTTEYRFQDPDTGKWHRFNELDRGFIEDARVLSESEQKISDVIKRFDELVAAGTPGIESAGKQIDAFEINAMVKNGRFAQLTGGEMPDTGFFETNFMNLLGSAEMQYERAQASNQFIRIANTSSASLVLNPAELQGIRQSTSPLNQTMKTANGLEVRVVKATKDTIQRVEVGGQIFRQLDDKIISKNNPLRQVLDDAGFIGKKDQPERFYHERVAENLERYAQLFEDTTGSNPIGKASDFLVGRWRELTLFHPAWMMTEMVGNVALMIMGGVDPVHVAKHATNSIKMVLAGNDPEKLAKIVFTLGDGRRINGREMLRISSDFYLDASRGAETAGMLHARIGIPSPGFGVPEPGGGTLRGSFGDIANRIKSMPQSVKTSLAGRRVMESGGDIKALTNGGPVPHNDSLYRRFFGGWFRADALLNNSMRNMAFLSYLEQGMDLTSAGRKVVETMFDMTDLTRTESNIGRRFLLPFYCSPDDADILTRSGWRTCDEVDDGDEVMTYNMESDELEWQPMLSKAIFDHDQALIRASLPSGKFDIRMTHNHRVPVEVMKSFVNGRHYGGGRKVVEAQDLKVSHKLITTAEYHGGDSIMTPEQARLYGWLLTDGYWRFKGNSCDACLYQSPSKYLEEVSSIAGGGHCIHPVSGQHQIQVPVKRLESIKHILRPGKNAAVNVVPQLSRQAAEAMYDAMYKADGDVSQTAQDKKFEYFANQSPGVLDAFRLLALLLGKKTTVSRRSSDGKALGCYISTKRGCRTVKVASCNKREEHYKGRVWCPRTKNGTWVMRQGDTITITGNSWIRLNGAYQVKQLFQRPAFAANFPRLQERIEEAIDGDRRVPQYMRPAWMREQMALQIGTDPDKRWSVLLRSAVPIGDAFETLAGVMGAQGAQNFFQYYIGSANPVFKVPVEIASGREIFSRREIGATSEQGDISIKDFALGQIRPLRETGIGIQASGAIPRAFRQGVGAGVARLAFGGRSQAFDEQRLRTSLVRQFKDRERRIRAAVVRAERDKNKDASLRARIRLMQLFSRMLEVGLEDKVPRWAKNQLIAIRQVGGDIQGDSFGKNIRTQTK